MSLKTMQKNTKALGKKLKKAEIKKCDIQVFISRLQSFRDQFQNIIDIVNDFKKGSFSSRSLTINKKSYTLDYVYHEYLDIPEELVILDDQSCIVAMIEWNTGTQSAELNNINLSDSEFSLCLNYVEENDLYFCSLSFYQCYDLITMFDLTPDELIQEASKSIRTINTALRENNFNLDICLKLINDLNNKIDEIEHMRLKNIKKKENKNKQSKTISKRKSSFRRNTGVSIWQLLNDPFGMSFAVIYGAWIITWRIFTTAITWSFALIMLGINSIIQWFNNRK